VIGNKGYGIPEIFLQKYPQFPARSRFTSSIILRDIHEDAGHTLIHFLYSGEYETINAPLDIDTSDIAREYKISILVYQAARQYGLATLEALAEKYIQRFGDTMSLPDILRETRDAFSTAPDQGETWLLYHLKIKLQHMLEEPARIACTLDEIYSSLGQNFEFDSIVLKMVVEILVDRSSLRGRTLEDGKGHSDRISSCSFGVYRITEYIGEVPIAEVIPVEEPAEDAPPVDNGWPEDAVPVKEPAEDAPPVDNGWPEDAVPVKEPAEDAPPVNNGWPEDAPQVDEPAYEDAPPVETGWPEDAVPVEEPAEYPPVETGWPEEAPPVDEPEPPFQEESFSVHKTAFAEETRQVDDAATGGYSSAADALPIEGSVETVQTHLVRVSYNDLASYRNWGSITSDVKARRASRLAAKGLPIPSEDGFVSIFVAGAGVGAGA
jgi:hypothetical protein